MTYSPVLPWWVLAIAALAVVVLLTVMLARKGRARRSAWLLRAAAVLLLMLAALRPGWPGGDSRAASADLDVYFVVDTSASMGAEDYAGGKPRLDGVRSDIAAVARELAGAKFALITFDGAASVRMPLSQDATALATAVEILQLQPPQYASGSSITVAAPVLSQRLKAAKEQHPGRPALVFYLGDGENTSAKAAGSFAVDAGLVDGGAVLGYGTAGGGRMKDISGDHISGHQGYIQDTSGRERRDAVSRIDEEQLGSLAAQLGVPYVHREAGATPDAMLSKARPGALTVGEDPAEGTSGGRVELYWLLAVVAFLLALHEPIRHAMTLNQLRERPAAVPEGGTP
ncbi:VWA domain-containing protein [Arthrobacter sp. AZCC_0090]|uniref:vWA domain-containing protein n=1 Tax=Arthrobacter sp. AZCC_0090 TaxID=2735881 RepID=UPI0016141D5D|nr:VWA domain-containing protein [Arthrobacter sp. AZCC_0090]MBB6403220.1 Ca-activated chloride channel family protein [Arthrobacter sp. AZCC_0090]